MKKNMKKIISSVIILLVVGGAFYGGTLYGKGQKLTNSFANLASGQARMQQFGNTAGNRQSGGFSSGEIIAKDANSITVKLRDGSSKIIFFSDSTKITKSVQGNLDDLKSGQNITVTGTTNQDGSITSQSIQIIPSISPSPSPSK